MSTATITKAQGKGLRHYFGDLSRAVSTFAAALYAAQGRQFMTQEAATKPLSARARENSRSTLFSMANECQDIAPSLSAELRYLASKG
jgi:hypothetical protein